MIPWTSVEAIREKGGNELTLLRRGDEWVIRIDGEDLMGSRTFGTEEALASLTASSSEAASPRTYLVGGLGMGFTARAILDLMGREDRVVVAEISDAVISWNERHLGDLAGRPLDDERLLLFRGDVLDAMTSAPERYAGIMLDVDNGPAAMTAGNDRLYSKRGISAAKRALCPGGVLAVWSASSDHGFERRMTSAGLRPRAHRVKGRGRRGPTNVIYLGI